MSDYDSARTPGQLIEALLADRGWSQRALAVVLGVGETTVNKLVADKQPVKAPAALQLGEIFGVPPERFLDLQKAFDLAQARLRARRDPGLALRAALFGDLPITAMIKRGWLNARGVTDVEQVQSELIRFFDAPSVDEIEVLPHAAKKTAPEHLAPAQVAWLYRVRRIAREMLVAQFAENSADVAMSRLEPLRVDPEAIREIPRILAECGIRLVIVETLPGAKIDGVCTWLDDRSPVIGMTLRFDRIDNFWFVLLHELVHVKHRHGQSSPHLDIEMDGRVGDDVAEEERVANAGAADFCVPSRMMDKFIRVKAPIYRDRDIIGMSRALKVHPGLVAGQLRFRTRQFNKWHKHLVKVRHIVRSSAVVDGWGDEYPID